MDSSENDLEARICSLHRIADNLSVSFDLTEHESLYDGTRESTSKLGRELILDLRTDRDHLVGHQDPAVRRIGELVDAMIGPFNALVSNIESGATSIEVRRPLAWTSAILERVALLLEERRGRECRQCREYGRIHHAAERMVPLTTVPSSLEEIRKAIAENIDTF